MSNKQKDTNEERSLNFIEQIIEEDLANQKHDKIQTRFPPEPNGYLHIGHAKAITINFGIAKRYNGQCNLRFDDTNPATESTEYVDSIRRDVAWLGFEWAGEYYASDYFDQLYEFAKKLIRKGLAYVDDSTAEEMAEMKGDTTTPGTNSPYRDRPVEENMELFEGMVAGEYPDGTRVLRAKIDMGSPNLQMRDPVLYRIKRAPHHRTGDKWNVYPMYDFAHGQSDAIEEVTHSLCSLEFRHHRPLYNWLIEKLEIFPSRQIEFARMNVAYMITSKRRLLRLVEEGVVTGWDDPRMPTISGMRRRGYPPEAIVDFCNRTGVAKRDNVIEMSLLEYFVRQQLNRETDRVMAVLNPLKVVITNYPEGESEELEAINNPEEENPATRMLPFSRELYIERADFMEDPPKKFFRLGPGRNVRLKNAYIIHCDDFVKDPETGEVAEVHCSYYPDSKSGEDTSGIKAKGTLHWVSVPHAKTAEVRQYSTLFSEEEPLSDPDQDFMAFLNPDSLKVIEKAYVEPGLVAAKPGERFQFMRLGYYCADEDSTPENPIFNLTVTLRDTWAKKKKQQKNKK
ncbi:MAG TPA: glutamine--tRNA ligase/YqeY domain fusion protein [Saprospiraceae bacterium]|nr:glutamine--tRNA ligase/YqeY domain fusion protein [Saprospiraceae bacterium]